MSDLGNPRQHGSPEQIAEHIKLILNHLRTLAHYAIDQEKWILAATTCRLIEELELDRATVAAADSAWRGTTVAVPLLNLPTLDDKPRPVAEAVYAHTMTCARCGKPAHWAPAVEATGNDREPRTWVPAGWVHDDAALGADHDVAKWPEPIWQCDRISVHDPHPWSEREIGAVRLYHCPGRTVDL